MPYAYKVDIRPILRLNGEMTPVEIGDSGSAPAQKAAFDISLFVKNFFLMRRDSVSLAGSPTRIENDPAFRQAQFYEQAAALAAAVGVTSPWGVGSQPVEIDHIWVDNGWHTLPGHFSFAFPITEEVEFVPPPPQPFERTTEVETTSGAKTLVAMLLVQVQTSMV